MRALLISLLAYGTAGVGALFGMWLAAKWPDPRWKHWLGLSAAFALAVSVGGAII
ncbi:MAG: hypothetical protein ACTHJ9_00620 [Rhodanobacter sp.]